MIEEGILPAAFGFYEHTRMCSYVHGYIYIDTPPHTHTYKRCNSQSVSKSKGSSIHCSLWTCMTKMSHYEKVLEGPAAVMLSFLQNEFTSYLSCCCDKICVEKRFKEGRV